MFLKPSSWFCRSLEEREQWDASYIKDNLVYFIVLFFCQTDTNLVLFVILGGFLFLHHGVDFIICCFFFFLITSQSMFACVITVCECVSWGGDSAGLSHHCGIKVKHRVCFLFVCLFCYGSFFLNQYWWRNLLHIDLSRLIEVDRCDLQRAAVRRCCVWICRKFNRRRRRNITRTLPNMGKTPVS